MLFDTAPGPIFRPPSEANSLILRVTLGCSHNQCSFCSMYKGTTFKKRTLPEIFTLIEEAGIFYPSARRVFLADGNALCLATDELIAVLQKLKITFPHLQRITSYAAPQDLLNKSVEELKELKSHGLQMVYLGLESGSDTILKKIRKGATSAEMILVAERLQEAGIKLSVMVILGLGGTEDSIEHIDKTATVVSKMNPNFLSALSLMIHPGTELRKLAEAGSFIPLSPYQMVEEIGMLLRKITPKSPIIFRSSHPSNFTILAGTLPKDQGHLILEAENSLQFLENYKTPEYNDHDRF
jgi:Fe-S oxidoreductase